MLAYKRTQGVHNQQTQNSKIELILNFAVFQEITN